MDEPQINIVIIEKHYILRKGLTYILNEDKCINVKGETEDKEKGIAIIRESEPDIVILDVKMFEENMDTLERIKKEFQCIKVIVFTDQRDSKILRKCIGLGADGYVLIKDVGEEIIDIVYRVYKGEKYIDKSLVADLFLEIQNTEKEINLLTQLTNREIEVLYLISKGYSNKMISEELFLSEKTVKNYASKLFKKIKAKDRVEASRVALENNIEAYYKAIRP